MRTATPRKLTKLSLLACVAAGLVIASSYGVEDLLVQLVAGFAASLLAFMLALTWERDREQKQRDRDREDEERRVEREREEAERRLEQDVEEQKQRLETEIRRRFTPVEKELETNHGSLEFLRDSLPKSGGSSFYVLHPQILWSAWDANAPRLSHLVADYDLISKLATTYGRLEELRWRLRFRSEHNTNSIDAMTMPLVQELIEETAALRDRVEKEIESPTIQPYGLRHQVALTEQMTISDSIASSG